MAAARRLALCVPAYNAASHLPRLLTSVRQQSSPFDEILLYDDASTDDTAEIGRRFGVTVIRGETNVGPSVGKNVLANAATAEWIHFHDADDAMRPEFVINAKQCLRPDVDVVLFDTEDRDDRTGAELGRRVWNDLDLSADAVRYCIVHTVTNCGVYRRSAFLDAGGFDTNERTKYNEDQAMHLRLALRGLRFRAAGCPGVIIFRRAGSMSGRPIECARAQYAVLADAAAATGQRYRDEIGLRLWRLAGVLGGFRDWIYVRHCMALAAELGYTEPANEHPLVRFAARISPVGAIMGREALIRLFKPSLRRGTPVVG